MIFITTSFDSGVALLQGAGPGLPNMDFLLEDFGHRLVPRKCISVGRSFSLWAPDAKHTLNLNIINIFLFSFS